ncbi:MAG: TraR/DksA C4-type zinc finger protein, partial [Rickettsiales bacterium]|nr:TraR/DksA C4-type zinc finger protein [Rickettsiales bacterium]
MLDKPLTELPKGYKPKQKEEYMNINQLEYFRRKLVDWRNEVLKSVKENFDTLKDNNESLDGLEEGDYATKQSTQQLNLKNISRDNLLLGQIDMALDRIKNRTFGYCIVTGDPIGIARLEARPIAKMTIEAQEEHEAME